MTVGVKVCSRCCCSKRASEFYKSRAAKDGLCSICKACEKKRDRRQTRPTPDRKVCSACSVEKSSAAFNKNSRASDGLQSACRMCNIEYEESRVRKQRVPSPEHKMCSMCNLVKVKSEFSKMSASRDGLQYRCKACSAEIEANRSMASRRSRNHNRRVRLANTESFTVLRKEIRRLYRNKCFNCGSAENQSIDHVVPLARGGRHSIGNLITLCTNCNSSKGSKTLSEWKVFLSAS